MRTLIPEAGRIRPLVTECLLRRSLAEARVVVITGSYGAGHDSAAREVAARFRSAGASVEVHDIVDLLPMKLGHLLRLAYLTQITRWPQTWEATLRCLKQGTRMHRWATNVLGAGSSKVLQLVAGADLVVSAHPFASQVLGRLRHDGALSCPAVTYLTDASVHTLWVARGVDLHLAIHAVAAAEARALGGRTTLVAPLTPQGPVTRPRSRAELGLPQRRPVGVVVGGSLGIGQLEATALDLLDSGVTPVVICGRNAPLLRRLSSRPGVVAVGWCDDVRELFAVADFVVQNSGGFMTLEAMSVGAPLLSYRVLPGHGRTNAAALELAGLARWVRSNVDLPGAVQQILNHAAAALPDAAPDLVSILAGPQPASTELIEAAS